MRRVDGRLEQRVERVVLPHESLALRYALQLDEVIVRATSMPSATEAAPMMGMAPTTLGGSPSAALIASTRASITTLASSLSWHFTTLFIHVDSTVHVGDGGISPPSLDGQSVLLAPKGGSAQLYLLMRGSFNGGSKLYRLRIGLSVHFFLYTIQ